MLFLFIVAAITSLILTTKVTINYDIFIIKQLLANEHTEEESANLYLELIKKVKEVEKATFLFQRFRYE